MATTESSNPARSTPIQRRAHERVDALLDAAAAIIDEGGLVALTTSGVAERSGSSVGVVYRYFPNADALLVALAERNRTRYMERVATALADSQLPGWQDFASRCIDEYGRLAAEEPAFRVIRFGDVIGMRYANRESSNNDELGRELDAILVERYGFPDTDDLVFATQLAMECADAVTRRAFLHGAEPDERFIRAAKRMIVAILTPHAPETYGRHYAL